MEVVEAVVVALVEEVAEESHNLIADRNHKDLNENNSLSTLCTHLKTHRQP